MNHNVLYKHEPVCINGMHLLKNNLWNFTLSYDGLMHNTQCPNFVLAPDETEFTPVFDFNDMEKRRWSSVYDTYDKNNVFVEERDVYSGKIAPSAVTYCWVRKSSEPQELLRLKQLYDTMVQYKQQYETAVAQYNACKEKLKNTDFRKGEYLEDFLERMPNNN